MKPKHQRLLFVAVSLIFLLASALLTLRAFRDNLVFFYSPAELAAAGTSTGRTVRVGGLVAGGSVVKNPDGLIEFRVTDQSAELPVEYRGLLPSLFREGQGVVAEGALDDRGRFIARTILAKHDENYMPREVVDSLKRSGRWQGAK